MKKYINKNNEIIISTDLAGQRIDNFLRKTLKGVPKTLIYRLLRKRSILINEKHILPKYKIQYGDKISLPKIRQSKSLPITNIDCNYFSSFIKDTLYEDDDLLIINKPAGIAVHSGSKLSFGVIEILRALRPNYSFLELVHQLDRYTSGVLLVAKNRSALRLLHQQLRMKQMQKFYLALVHGKWPSNIKVVSAPLQKQMFNSGKNLVLVNPNGKPSVTRFKIVEQFNLATLVKAHLITGHTHQIRVHSTYVGHPIICDDRYGDIKCDNNLIKCGLNRMFLHAASLCFEHPKNSKKIYITAPLDDNLRKCLSYMRTNNKIL